jgi:hypothetical protein
MVASVDFRLSGFGSHSNVPFHHNAISQHFYSYSEDWAEVEMRLQIDEGGQGAQTRFRQLLDVQKQMAMTALSLRAVELKYL